MPWLLNPINKIMIGVTLVLVAVLSIFTLGVKHQKGKQASKQLNLIRSNTRIKRNVQTRISATSDDAVVKRLRQRWKR